MRPSSAMQTTAGSSHARNRVEWLDGAATAGTPKNVCETTRGRPPACTPGDDAPHLLRHGVLRYE